MRTLRTIGIAGSAVALLFSATTAFAQESAVNMEGAGAPVKNTSGMYRPTAASTTRGEIGKAAQERMQATHEEAKFLLETKREEAKNRMTAQREKAEKRLTDIQDKKKQQEAQRLAKQFEKLNSKWTDHFMELLNRHDGILQKIQDRANVAASNGKDVTATNAAIQSAKTAIASARTAVIAQAAKTYALDASVVTTTTSTTTQSGQKELLKSLRTSFQSLHKTLFKDLFALRDGAMTDARKAVQSAHQTLSKIPGIDEGNATSTAAAANQ